MSQEDERARRLRAQAVNVGLVAVAPAQQLPRDEPIPLRCECGRETCCRRVLVAAAEYQERVRGFSRLFLAPGHETGEGRLLERTERFVLVDLASGRVVVEVLSTDGCPNAGAAVELVEEVGKISGVDFELRQIRIGSAEEALRYRFLGSPSVRVDGRDVEPGAELRLDFALGCRLYAFGGRPAHLPRTEWIEAALGQQSRGATRTFEREQVEANGKA